MALGQRPTIGFAHRGARDRAPDNTLEGFALALELGASGLESDVWLTADGVPVLDHDGLIPGRGRGRLFSRGGRDNGWRRPQPIAHWCREELPPGIPSLEDLYAICGRDFELSLDVMDPAAFAPVMAVAAVAGATDRLWLCQQSFDQLAAWRREAGDARLVHSACLRRGSDPARQAVLLERVGIDAVNLKAWQWRRPWSRPSTGGTGQPWHGTPRPELS